MPRKSSVRRKESSGGAKSTKVATPRKSTHAVVKDEDDTSQDAERSRRSSTAAQTAASAAESRVTRSKNPKRESVSPVARESKSVETSASRKRSSRRSAQNVNYKESDGEEEIKTLKNEDDFESNEDFDDSDSDEKNKKKGKKSKSLKGRSAKPRARVAPKSNKRSRSKRKKKESEDEEEEEEEETVEISDESDQEKDQSETVKEAESKSVSSVSDRRKSRAAQPPTIDISDSERSSGRRSRRTSTKSAAPAAEPTSKRPSRNKQVKKYTEVDEEDFSEPKSESEPEVKKESSRKRKRDSDSASSKRAKQDLDEAETEKVKKDYAEKSLQDDVKGSGNKETEEADCDSSDEPMEIDESVPDEVKPESEGSKKTAVASVDENTKPVGEPSVKSAKAKSEERSEVSCQAKKQASVEVESKKQEGKVSSETKDAKDTSQSVPDPPKLDEAKSDSCEEKSSSDITVPVESKKTEPKDSPMTGPSNQDIIKTEPKSEKNVISAQSNDDAFPSKESVPPATPLNGEDNRNTIDAATPKDAVSYKPKPLNFENQNDTAPKTNGAQDELDDKRTSAKDSLCVLPNRKHVFNRYISEDLRLSLKEGTFGIVSCNLSTGMNADKLIRELDKLQASIVCLQEVSQSFFTETLQSKLDVLGYKAVTNSPWSDSGLVTFYKSSLFRLCSGVVDIPIQTLISQALDSSELDESEKQAVSGCYDKCGNVLIAQLASVLGSHAVTVANVKIPQCSLSLNALQVCCVVRKISTLREHIKPVLICGEFNSCETEVPYQLVRNGYLSERMIEELKCRKDGAECIPLIKLLQAKCGILCCAMCSCYNTVLGKDVEVPKQNSARDILWASADNLHIVGVLDVSADSVDLKNDHRVSLKADVAFFV